MSMLPFTPFGVLLRRDRRAAGLTQAELAARAGMSEDTISVLERGRTRAPHKETLHLLAEALDLTPSARARWGIRYMGNAVTRLRFTSRHASAVAKRRALA